MTQELVELKSKEWDLRKCACDWHHFKLYRQVKDGKISPRARLVCSKCNTIIDLVILEVQNGKAVMLQKPFPPEEQKYSFGQGPIYNASIVSFPCQYCKTMLHPSVNASSGGIVTCPKCKAQYGIGQYDMATNKTTVSLPLANPPKKQVEPSASFIIAAHETAVFNQDGEIMLANNSNHDVSIAVHSPLSGVSNVTIQAPDKLEPGKKIDIHIVGMEEVFKNAQKFYDIGAIPIQSPVKQGVGGIASCKNCEKKPGCPFESFNGCNDWVPILKGVKVKKEKPCPPSKKKS